MDAPMVHGIKTFCKDKSQIKQVTSLLIQCGCCVRCVLRYLGEKDAGIFRKPLKDLNTIVLNTLSSPEGPSDQAKDISDENQIDVLTKGETNLQETVEPNGESATENIITDEDISDKVETSGSDLKSTEDVLRDRLLSDKPCTVCLGILQEFSSENFINKIDDAVIKADFEFKDYICSLTIPVCVLVRERALLAHLQEQITQIYGNISDTDISAIKDVWKWRNGPVLVHTLGVPFNQKSKFDIALIFTYKRSDKECNFLVDFRPDIFRKRKQTKSNELFSRANVSKALSELTDDYLKKIYSLPPKPPDVSCKCDEIRCTHEAVYLAGRYNKYSRTLSQTPWMVDGKRKSESSVEEEICRLIKHKFKYEDERFSSSGREDVDVKMLGTGRPFVIEMINPHRVNFSQEDLQQLQKDINSNAKDVQVRDIQIVNREETNILKEGETEKTKVYSALCCCTSPLKQEDLDKFSDIKDLVLQQKTPIRVLHRRPLATRERTVYKLSAEYVDDNHFKLHLSTQAGTYVKEFVHGDFGRTKPNLSSLTGVDCDILELDVESVELEWPKRLDTN